MSGGHFNYDQYKIIDMIEEIDSYVRKNEYLNYKNEYVQRYEPRTLDEFVKAIKALRVAYIYAHRIDWLLSCDDSEDSFRERLKEELDKLEGEEL